MSNLTTIKYFTNQVQVQFQMAKSFLESEGIKCFAKDETMSRMLGPVFTQIQMQVVEEDAEKAIALLIEGGFANPEDFEE